MNSLAGRAEHLRLRVRRACESCGRDPKRVDILPVSKFQPLEAVREALSCGFQVFGENYVQEGMAKAQALPEAAFVLQGPLQRNKARPALQHFREILTVDRVDLARRLARLAEEMDLVRPVWIQIDLWEERTKLGGCGPGALPEILDVLRSTPYLPLKGFMAIPPPEQPGAFLELARLREDWRQRLGQELCLSMGMSLDLEAAIRAGSDQVRVGTALFGDREGGHS